MQRARLSVAHVATGQVSTHLLDASGARIGRAPANDIVLDDPRIARAQGSFTWQHGELFYEHLRSENCPSSLHRDGRIVALDGGSGYCTSLADGDELILGDIPGLVLLRAHLQQTASEPVSAEQLHQGKSFDVAGHTLLRAAEALGRDALASLQCFALEASNAEGVRELSYSFAGRVFDAYPAANHLSIFLASEPTGTFEPFLAFRREGMVPPEPLSRSIDELLQGHHKAFLFHAGDTRIHASASLKIARVRAGMCAPMWNGERVIGVVQLDRRGKLGGGFHGSDLELLTVFAHHLATFLDSKATAEKLRLEVVQLKRARARMAALAYSDPLTGLPNRRLFLDRLEQVLARSSRSGTGFALMYIDLDRLKQINDRFGHDRGDLVIQSVAARLRGCVRGPDTVARLGGDEFAIILDGVDSAEAASTVARKITQEFCEPIHVEDDRGSTGVHATVSLGVALAPRDGRTAAELLAVADAAMYRNKNARATSRA